MGKSILILLACFAMAPGIAQNKAKFGINGGLNYSSFRGNPMVEQFDAGFSYLGGISFEYFLKDNLSFETNLNYERKTAVNKATIRVTDMWGTPNSLKIKEKIYYDYLVLPILMNYYVNEKKDFYINGGYFVGYLLQSGFSSNQSEDFDNTDLNKKVDLGLLFGFGKKIKLNAKNELGIEIRENLGLINTSDARIYNNGSIKTNAINLITTWNFDI